MKPILGDGERRELDRRVAELERRTGSQIVLAVTRRSDSYAELPWKAFALGVSVAGLGAVTLQILRPGWYPNLAVLSAVVLSLATGAACALLCIALPSFARLFLDSHRAEVEVNQYAQSLFLSRELFATHGRMGILLLVSIFERQVILHPDTGAAKLLGSEAMRGVVDSMKGDLASGRVDLAFKNGLGRLESILPVLEAEGTSEEELPNTVIEGRDE
jgi:putative membrane protein